MTNEEIYSLYRKTEYDTPKLMQVLADVCNITVSALQQIIKDGDEKTIMARWSQEQIDIYNRMTSEGAEAEPIATAMGVKAQAIYCKRSNEKAKAKKLDKPVISQEPDDTFDSDSYASGQTIDDIPDIDTGEDLTAINSVVIELCEPLKKSAIDINKQISKLCDTPEPKPRTIFDEAHSMLWNLEASAKRSRVTPDEILLMIDPSSIKADVACLGRGVMSFNIKNPLASVEPNG